MTIILSCSYQTNLFRDNISPLVQDTLEDMRLRNSGFVAALSACAISPYTLSVRVVAKSARALFYFFPSESTVKALINMAPELAVCPFAHLSA